MAASDEDRLRDADFMSNLSQLRQQHKKTFSIIESLYNDYGNYVRPLSTNEYDADAFDYCNRGYLGERRSKSVQSLLHSCECWQEERTVQFTEEEWIPQITVPKPFQMTLRDEKAPIKASYSQKFIKELTEKKQEEMRESVEATNKLRDEKAPIKASYSQKFIKELTEKKQEEMRESVEATNKLRCKAREVPRSTYEPIYEQMLVDMERAREERHRRAAQMIQRSRRPFSALTTSTTNFHMRRCASAEASEWEKRETFKANEVPMSVYLPPYKDEIQAALRAKARTQRAIKLIQASKAPTGMQVVTHSLTTYQQNVASAVKLYTFIIICTVSTVKLF
uniref:Protein FAM161A n=1 Tax=Ascaris lumbricoides TaxID=6252 RepID=A0A0M3I5B3_ASCLU